MKKLLLLSVLLITFAGCEKHDRDDENACPVLAPESVPQATKDAFNAKYKNAVVDTWFNKDNSHVVAKFIIGSKTTFTSFSNTGEFESEKIKWENEESDNQDNDDEEGCDCDDEEEGD